MKLSAGLLALAAAGAAAADELAHSPPFYPSPWMDGDGDWAVAYQRAKNFVAGLTLAEKVNLTTGTGFFNGRCVGETGTIPRLGFQALCLQDGPLGIRRADHNTAFPAAVNVASTFDKKLAYERGKAMGEEFRDKGVDVGLAPSVGPLGRTPFGGRNWEGFSVDPVNSAKLGAETIKGMQDAGVIANVKHLVGYEQEHFRKVEEAGEAGFNITDPVSSNIDDVTLHELYLWPFADAVRAGVGSLMCSYNQINNSYGCQNSYMMNKILKAELGFQGFVVSDWEGQHGGVASTLAGLDMAMPGDTGIATGHTFWGTNTTIAVLNGTVPQWRLDDQAVRIMSAYFKVGRDAHRIPLTFSTFENDEYGYAQFSAQKDYMKINDFVDVRKDHAKNAREVAAKSIVLLKNEKNALPLTGYEKDVGIHGEDAGPNINGPNSCEDRTCDEGTLAMSFGSGTSEYPYLVTPYEAIQNRIHEIGVGGVQAVLNNSALEQFEKVAKRSNVNLVFVNANAGEGLIEGKYGDLENLDFWKGGEKVIETVTANSDNVIVVIHAPGPVNVASFYDHPNITAILWAGLPGQESGSSLVDVLYGKVNPAGRTPFTWAKNETDYGVDIQRVPNNGMGAPQATFNEGVFVDYRHFDKNGIEPIYEFGYGLSYTKFNYTNIKVSALPAPKYTPAKGQTKPARVFGEVSNNTADYTYPADLDRTFNFVYPWLNTTDLKEASGDPNYGWPDDKYIPAGAKDGSAQPVLPAGGGPGGNPRLWDELYEITATIENVGDRIGEEVPQLYVSLGGPNDPKVVLREFDRVTVAPGTPYTWRTTLTRRDLSNWNPVTQNWEITDSEKTVFVGSSSRKLHLEAKLPKPYYVEDLDLQC